MIDTASRSRTHTAPRSCEVEISDEPVRRQINAIVETTAAACARAVRHLLAMWPAWCRHCRPHHSVVSCSALGRVPRQRRSSAPIVQQLSWRTHANWRSATAHIEAMVTPHPVAFSATQRLSTPSPPANPSHEQCGGLQERPRSPQGRLELSNLSCESSR